VHKKNGDFGSVLTDMPLGVLSMSSYLKKHTETEAILVDFNIVLNKLQEFEFDTFEAFFNDFFESARWIEYKPDIIGISTLFTPAYQNMLDIGQSCRNQFPGSIIVAGGGVPTNMYKEIYRDSYCFDALCYGEGEKPLLGLAAADDKVRYLEENDSWITWKKIERLQSFSHDFIDDLDEIPLYDYGICEMDDYGLNPAITAYASIEEKRFNFHIMTSRGCPSRCCFCSSHTIHGRRIRYHSLSRVKNDIKFFTKNYGVKTFVFQDDHFLGNRQRALEIIDTIKKMQVRAVFQNGLALNALDRKMLEALRGAGVDQLLLSVESGSSRVLKEIMHKPLSLSIIKRVARDCRELGIYTNVNILIGLPGETKADIEEGIAFLKAIYGNWFLIFCANPLVGSEMYKICIESNYLKNGFIGSDYKKAVVSTEEFDAEYIQKKSYSMNLQLNFVENSDVRLGDYNTALKEFNNAIRARSDHAFAYYYAAICYKNLNSQENYITCKNKYQEIINESPFWKDYANQFGLDPL
jgi:radical SAM superfamily enzyme YgiQ (UPF0313 family)